MNVTRIFSLSAAIAAVVLASGCSVQGGAAKIEAGFSAIAHSMQKFDEPVQTEQVGENEYRLWQTSFESFKNFDSMNMRTTSKQLCPIGYYQTSRQVRSNAELKETDAECVGGTCKSTLEWYIRCQDIPEEPFTLFGKT